MSWRAGVGSPRSKCFADWDCYYSNLSSGHLAELINPFHLCYIVDIR